MQCCFFFTDTATTEIYTLSLHDALPIYHQPWQGEHRHHRRPYRQGTGGGEAERRHRQPLGHPHLPGALRSEEHTSELQSQSNLVCRLLLEKKKIRTILISSVQCQTPSKR